MKSFLKLWLTSLFVSLTSVVFAQPVRWHNPLQSSFPVVRGRGWQEELKDNYARLPQRFKDVVRPQVWNLSRESAGLSVDFRSNAKEIRVKYVVSGGFSMPHMPATGVSGVDLYATDSKGNQRWCAAKYAFGDTITYTYTNLWCSDMSEGDVYRLYLPPYNSVKFMEIGVPDGAEFHFLPVKQKNPLVIYGTSIAQGACASRPGMMWGNILDRTTGHPVINLGFSGNGRLEPELFKALAEIKAGLYIIDCMPNLTGKDTSVIYDRTLAGVKLLRAKTQTPILLVEHCGYMNDVSNHERRQAYAASNKELKRAFNALKNQKVKGLYYLTKEELGFTSDCQVEGVHANDVGMMQYAKAYGRKIKEILK